MISKLILSNPDSLHSPTKLSRDEEIEGILGQLLRGEPLARTREVVPTSTVAPAVPQLLREGGVREVHSSPSISMGRIDVPMPEVQPQNEAAESPEGDGLVLVPIESGMAPQANPSGGMVGSVPIGMVAARRAFWMPAFLASILGVAS